MSQQLAFQYRLDHHTHLEDYVGDAAALLASLSGLVFVYGPAATGKSHLLQGLCHKAQAEEVSVLYLPSLRVLGAAVLDGLDQFQLVCLDDIDDVIEDPDWQEALFHLINAMRDRGLTLVVSSSVAIAALELSLADLESRLRGAYRVKTDTPDDDQKLEIIRRKADRLGFFMGDEVCRFILARAQRDMHHLAMLVDQLDRETLRSQKKVTIPFVKAALGL